MSEAVVATPAVEEVKMDVEATTSTAENKQTETSEHVEVPPLAEKAGESVVSAAKPDKEVTPDNEEVRQSAIRQGTLNLRLIHHAGNLPRTSRILLRGLEPPIRQVRKLLWNQAL